MLQRVKTAWAYTKVALAAAWAKSKAVGMSLAVAASLTLPAFAGETTGGTTGGGLASVTSAADTVTTFVGKVFTIMTGNPYLCVFMAASLLGTGIRVFVRLRRAAH